MRGDIVDQGLELMLFGMGTVVVFLTLLILSTTLMSWFLGRYYPEPETPVSGAGRPVALSPQSVDQDRLVAVITAAIHRHRKGKK
jgi:oxaloacetate decarboxylase gamma subunit